MATTVIAERPTPVNSRATNKPFVSHTHPFSRENAEYHATVTTSARLRPTRSENQPPAVAPTNMPRNVADTITLMVETDRCQAFNSAGAANENVLISPSSKKNTNPSSHVISRW